VNETGVNTNQKDDDNLGGELFIAPSDDSDAQFQGATTVDFARKAIAKRGWFPVSFALLEDPVIAKTRDINPINNTMTTSSISAQDAPILQLEVPVVNWKLA
jgi:hypothetical protein